MKITKLIAFSIFSILLFAGVGCNLLSSEGVFTYKEKNVAYDQRIVIDDFVFYRDGVISFNDENFMTQRNETLEFFYKRKNGVVKFQVKRRFPDGKFVYLVNEKDIPYNPYRRKYHAVR